MLLLALVLAATPAKVEPGSGPPHSVGFPEIAVGLERVLVGGERPVGKARKRGSWTWTEAGVAKVAAAAYGQSYWFPSHPAAVIGDGAVRARVRFGEHVDLSIMFRCKLPNGDLERLSGYGLSIARDALRFDRWEKGLPRPVGASVEVPELGRLDGVEAVVILAGPLITALVYDLKTLEPIATLTMTDARFSFGSIGLYAHRRQDPATVLSMLTVLHSTDRRDGEAVAVRNRQSSTGRIVRLEKVDEARIPEDLRDSIVSSDEEEIVLLVYSRQMARLRRAGLLPTSVSGDVGWRYLDADYARASERGVTSTPTGFVIDESYKDPEMVEALLQAYHRRFPDITHLEALGTTPGGRTVWALKISDNASQSESEPAVMLNGSHHGSELLPTEFVLDAIQQLLERYDDSIPIRDWVDTLEIWCVPLVNPDGRDYFVQESVAAGRKNRMDTNGDGTVTEREGVDLNRNYPFKWGALGEIGSRSWPDHPHYRGNGPATAPEVQAMMALAERQRFVAAISYHTSGTTVMPPYATRTVPNPSDDEAWVVAEEIAAATPVQPNGKRYKVRRRLYDVDGVEKDWLRFTHGTLALVVEGPLHNPRDPKRRRRAVKKTRPTWATLLARFFDGPSVSGVVRDGAGDPLEAEVEIVEIGTQASERWTTRPLDGLFARFLPRPGEYTLVVSAPGYSRLERRLEIDHRIDDLVLVLEPEDTGDPAAAH